MREVRYQCLCGHVNVRRFSKDYVPWREWMDNCAGCGKRTLQRALGRIVTGKFRGGVSKGR